MNLPAYSALLIATVFAITRLGAASGPDWVQQAELVPTPAYVGNAAAVVLLDQTSVEVDAEGTATTTHRLAIRILDANGRDWAEASVSYLKDTEKVRANAWLLRKGNVVRPPHDLDWADVNADSSSLYSEARRKEYRRRDAVEGDVFAAETRRTGPLLTADEGYRWGWRIPVVEERFDVRVPPGFSLQPHLVGETAPRAVTSVDGLSTSWIVEHQPYVPEEPHRLDIDRSKPAVFVAIRPPPGSNRFKPLVANSWSELTQWVHGLVASQCDSSAEIATESQRLVSGVTSPTEKIRAIAKHVQQLRYVALGEGLGRGLGIQPRKASRVFKQGYGDCKDKANLMCAMLREVGIEAHIVAVLSAKDFPIREEWITPWQFDHAIVAIRVDDSLDSPAVLPATKWGRLLFFDPTHPYVALGEIPLNLQGTLGLVEIAGNDGLIRLPEATPPAARGYTRRLSLELGRNGICSGTAQIDGRGQAAAEFRRELIKSATADTRRRFIATLLGDSLKTGSLADVTNEEDEASHAYRLRFAITKPNQLQWMPNGLAVAKMELLTRDDLPTLSAQKRHRPVKIAPLAWDDVIDLTLADGLTVEELPAAVSLKTEYGTYQRSFVVEGNKLRLLRTFILPKQIVPAADYPALKKFLGDVAKADRSSVLLRPAS